MTIDASLFDRPADSTVSAASGWIEQALVGPIVTDLGILAVAIFGLAMLGGRLPVRDGVRVILGCFVLLGAQAIAGALLETGGEARRSEQSSIPLEQPAPYSPPATLEIDPYAGASQRRD